MNRRDELRERYEDALFAFLMEDVIETEGKKMLEENERLKQDPLAAVPEAVDYRCIQTIKRGFVAHFSYSNYTIKLVNSSTATLDYMRKVRTVFCPDFLAQS